MVDYCQFMYCIRMREVYIYMQSLHLICYVKSLSICKVSITMQCQSLHQIFKLSTHLFAVKSLLSSKAYINLISFLYNYICKHYHYSRNSSSSSSSCFDVARSSISFEFFPICSYHTSLSLRQPSNNFLADSPLS